jgi:hypothetical protein
MKRKIYAGLIMGGILFAQGLSCIGPVRPPKTPSATAPTALRSGMSPVMVTC